MLTKEQTAAAMQAELQALTDRVRQAERARVIRIRNACFAGLRVDDDVRAALARFDGMLLRGEDVPS